MRLLIAFISILMLMPVAMGGTDTISIYGMTAAGAQTNMTKTGNQSVNVSQWGTGGAVKNISVNVTATSDTLTFNLYNITVGMVIELRVNNTVINGYQANRSGAIKFSYTQAKSNVSYKLQPAINYGGYNFTWGFFTKPPWFTSQNTTATCTVDTVYYNEASTARMVQGAWQKSDGGFSVQAKTDSANPPTTVADIGEGTATNYYGQARMIVLAGNYYMFDTAQTSVAKQACMEWN